MSVGQPFRVLNFYDVLTNLIPGIVLVGSLYIYYPFEFSISGVILVLVLGYLTGHFIQFVRSRLPSPTTFQNEMAAIDDENSNSESENEITEISENFLALCREEFELSDDYTSYGELFKLLLSFLETSSAQRSIRFQAIFSFHRSMMISMVLTGILAIGSLLGHQSQIIRLQSPALAVVTVVLSGIFGTMFYSRKEKFEKEFVHYVILDFYQDRVTN